MVKATYFIVLLATVFALASAQIDPEVLAELSSIASRASSFLANPTAVQSYVAKASELATLLPKEEQASYYSALAEASQYLDNPSNYMDTSSALMTHPAAIMVYTLTLVTVFALAF